MNGKQWTTGVAAAAVLLSSGVTAMAQQPRTPGATSHTTMESLSAGDRQFILDATRVSERDVELGELAKEKGQSITVKELGARMVADHGRIARELKRLALSKGLRVGDTKRPEEPSYDRLTKLSSPAFDKAYLEAMAKDQEQDVAEFRRMSEQGQDPDLKAWAARTLPTLEGQLQTVKAIQGTMQGAVR
jgi:putative membrane protein